MIDRTLIRLLAWLSPGFPTGGYTYSHGLEFAVEEGLVIDRGGLERWIAGVIRFGAGRSDAVLFSTTHRAVTSNDEEAFRLAVETADAMDDFLIHG